MMGSLQWAVSIGRFDITTAVMTMSSFRTMLRKGHRLLEEDGWILMPIQTFQNPILS